MRIAHPGLSIGLFALAGLLVIGCGETSPTSTPPAVSKNQTRPLTMLATITRRQLREASPIVARCTQRRGKCLQVITRAGGLINQLQIFDLTIDALQVVKGSCRTALARERSILEEQLVLIEKISVADTNTLARLQGKFSGSTAEHQSRLGIVARDCRDIRVPRVPLG